MNNNVESDKQVTNIVGKQKKEQASIFKTIQLSIIISFLVQPFEVLRTTSIIKNNDIKNINFKGFFYLVNKVYKEDGLKGFFRGSTFSLYRNLGSYSVFFTSLQQFQYIYQNKYKQNNLILESSFNFINAAFCRLLSTLLVSPITVLKTRFEIAGQNEYQGILQSTRKIYQSEGIKGFYTGIVSTLLRDTPASGLQFTMYQNLLIAHKYFHKHIHCEHSNQDENELYLQQCNKQMEYQPNTFVISACGSISGIFSLIIVQPFDNIRVRQQCSKVRQNMIEVSKIIYKNNGIKGFYVGYLPRVIKKAVGGSIIWPMYESFKTKDNQNI